MKETFQYILDQLPYEDPFLFVDQLISVSEDGIHGYYSFPEDSFFYRGHFKDNPVTPGVILTECMAQIGVVCLGIYLLQRENIEVNPQIALSCIETDFYLPVFPGERVEVHSERVYFRFNKLKCKVKMTDSKGRLIAKGVISGMLIARNTNSQP